MTSNAAEEELFASAAALQSKQTPAIPPAYYRMINSQTKNEQISGHKHFKQHHCYKEENIRARNIEQHHWSKVLL
jgi:hypothetical protein